MFGAAWLTLRQVREALRSGRLEEASRLLGERGVRGHKRAFALQQEVIRGFVERAERNLRADAIPAAWEDVRKAELLSPNDPTIERFRQRLLSLGRAEAKAALEAGRPGRAAEAVARIRDRGARQAELHPFDEAARNWLLARESADAGEFALALKNLDGIQGLMPPPTTGLDDFRNQLLERQESYQQGMMKLHEAMQQRQWRETVMHAEQVLKAAPQCGEARKARATAWKMVEPETTLPGENRNSSVEFVLPAEEPRESLRRLLLWIDGVGGYLICLTNRVTLGQATGDAPVDVPLLADVSRMHATLSRDSEGYLIEAARPVLVNGQSQTRATLHPGDRVTLGTSCQFLFQKPVPISSSAKLEMVSGHRLPLSVGAVLLMADSLVLGGGSQVHVPIPDRSESLVLFRHKDGLGLRCPGDFTIDGKRCKDKGVLGIQAAAQGPDFALAIEPAGRI